MKKMRQMEKILGGKISAESRQMTAIHQNIGMQIHSQYHQAGRMAGGLSTKSTLGAVKLSSKSYINPVANMAGFYRTRLRHVQICK